jgi:hypothetical protein
MFGRVERPSDMHTRRSLIAFALLGTLLLTDARAEAQLAPPTIFKDWHGAFHIDFTTPNVFDLSSDWVSHGSNGKLSGLLRTTDGGGIDLIHKFSGSCKMSRGVTTVKQRILIGGTVGNGDEYNSVSNFEGTMVGYGLDAKLVGDTVTKVCLRYDLQPFSKRKIIVCDVQTVLDEMWSHDGRWAIRLEFDNVGKKLTGTANVYVAEFNPGKAKQYATTVTGKLDPDGEANFKLTPIDDNGIGGTIKLRAVVIPRNGDTPPELVEILEVGGKILGQKFDEVY